MEAFKFNNFSKRNSQNVIKPVNYSVVVLYQKEVLILEVLLRIDTNFKAKTIFNSNKYFRYFGLPIIIIIIFCDDSKKKIIPIDKNSSKNGTKLIFHIHFN